MFQARPAVDMMMKSIRDGRRFFISCFFFLLFLCVLASINELRFDGRLMKFHKCAFSDSNNLPSSSAAAADGGEIRILVGILTLPDQYRKRHFLRLVYGTQSPRGAKVDVKFVFCNLTKEDQKTLVALEIMRHDDIIILDCQENMNNGKTYTFFSSLPEILGGGGGGRPYDYVMKADDDTYLRLENLVASLTPLPRQDLYYGFVIPCTSMDPFKHYMSGMGYLISWDLVEWIRESDIPKANVEGPEDKVLGEWLRDGRRGLNRFNAKWSMYNFPVEPPNDGCSHEFWPETVAVHQLKTQEKWIRTLSYFNVTRDLMPSKLYHIQ
ncbi:PREDICTED: beta-1,3-galactosyltransferase 6 isoform X2 [Ipomoea nil]|uniref:beta-1,3-galactosyltransferase 6 isoform X2 n=1 Tax=Ipomoea nil TaxID=35883 RepID=UPI000901B2FC|nr:PREDICTED: beta-1,3-galactosyltransferase 6 isoform X2 [Ipomoea nil]